MNVSKVNFGYFDSAKQQLKPYMEYKRNDNNSPEVAKENKAYWVGAAQGAVFILLLCYADYAINYFADKKINSKTSESVKNLTKTHIPFVSLFKKLPYCF